MVRISDLLPQGLADPQHHRGARRQSKRFPLNAEVSILEPFDADGVVLNASVGGLRVALDREVTNGEKCLVWVRFTHERGSVEHCRIIWTQEAPDGWVVGLEFLPLH